MKKTLIAALATVSFGASAANYVSIDVESVRGLGGTLDSSAQYVRAGTELGGIQWGLQSRTARFEGGAALSNNAEFTAGKKMGFVVPFIGIGHDNGLRNKPPFNYGLVGAYTQYKVGPGSLLSGVKTRVGSTEAIDTKQTTAFAIYNIPVTKTVSVNLNANKSYQTIKHNAFGVGLQFNF